MSERDFIVNQRQILKNQSAILKNQNQNQILAAVKK